jgi:type IX secretion system PorP/SprF family membrane protein
MRSVAILLLCLLQLQLAAQRMAQQNMYLFNSSLINPAASGMSECATFDLYGLRQWIGIKHAPSLEGCSFQKGYRTQRYKKHGLGANVVRDINGPSGSLGGELMYSFHFQVNRDRNTWLGLGLSGIILQNSIDESGFSPLYDPIIAGGMEQELFYNASAGCVFYSDKFYAMAAVYNLIPLSQELASGYGFNRYFTTLSAGFVHKKRTSIVAWRPGVYSGIGDNILQTDISNRFEFSNNISVGLILRKYWLYGKSPGQDALFVATYTWNRWSLEYAYDMGINGLLVHQTGSHMGALHYRICRDKYACPTYK